jgi:hypothetical protein
MKTLFAVAAVVLSSVGVAHALGPGAGGAMTCSAVSSGYNVLVGSDNSGLYERILGSSTWLRYGSANGLTTTNILSICFGNNPRRAVVGGDGGLFYCTHFSDSTVVTWTSVPTISDGASGTIDVSTLSISAVTFGVYSDSNAIFVAYTDANDRPWVAECLDITAATPSWTRTPCTNLPTTAGYLPVKIAEDPNAVGSSRDILLLFGDDASGKGSYRELWRTSDLESSGTSWTKVHGGSSGGPDHPIDFAFYPYQGGPSHLVVSASSAGSGSLTAGRLYLLRTSDLTWTETHPYTYANDSTSAASKLTGAVWEDGTNEYLVSIEDIGATGSPSPPKCSTTIPANAGVWYRPMSSDTARWRRSDDGSSWQLGWSSCNRARGALGDGVAKCISRMKELGAVPAGYGPYLGSMSFEWEWTGSSFVRVHTTNDVGSSSFGSTMLDNANAVMLAKDPSGHLWVGYYDVGL